MVTHTMKALETPTQTLSALIDGELSDDQAKLAIKQWVASAEMRAHHAEYIAIGDAMRGISEQHGGLTRKVMAALEQQPVVLAPRQKPINRSRTLWLAAATMTALTWGLWQSDPRDPIITPMATSHSSTLRITHQIQDDAQPYLAAHQDFVQAVMSNAEMRFSNASLEVRP